MTHTVQPESKRNQTEHIDCAKSLQCFWHELVHATVCTFQRNVAQEETLRRKQEAQKRQQQKPSTHDADTADSSHAAAASAETAALLPADKSRAAAEPALSNSIDKGKPSIEDARKADSPFACVSAILGWETFHMVHVLWIGLVDLPGKAPEKDWEMQVGVVKPHWEFDSIAVVPVSRV